MVSTWTRLLTHCAKKRRAASEPEAAGDLQLPGARQIVIRRQGSEERRVRHQARVRVAGTGAGASSREVVRGRVLDYFLFPTSGERTHVGIAVGRRIASLAGDGLPSPASSGMMDNNRGPPVARRKSALQGDSLTCGHL